jgi:biopolymer transport protein ExbB/biopolymer transport protein TolQ
MSLLGTLGNNAPFIGLLGTVLGVIQAFHQLGDGGAGQNKAAMGNVMTGIAEALIATGVGLVVAIPAVVAFNVAQKKIGEIESNVTSIGKQLLALLKFSPRERSGKAAFQASDEAEKIAADERAAEGHGRAAEREDAFPASPANGAHHSPNGAVSAMEA